MEPPGTLMQRIYPRQHLMRVDDLGQELRLLRVSNVRKVFHSTRGTYTALDGASLTAELPNIAVLVAMGLVMIPGAIWVFSWAERRAKRLGLLKRSGERKVSKRPFEK